MGGGSDPILYWTTHKNKSNWKFSIKFGAILRIYERNMFIRKENLGCSKSQKLTLQENWAKILAQILIVKVIIQFRASKFADFCFRLMITIKASRKWEHHQIVLSLWFRCLIDEARTWSGCRFNLVLIKPNIDTLPNGDVQMREPIIWNVFFWDLISFEVKQMEHHSNSSVDELQLWYAILLEEKRDLQNKQE